MKAKLEEEAKQAILLQQQWFRAVTDGNEAKVAELLAANPAVTDMLSCIEASPRGLLGPVVASSLMLPRGDANTGCCCTALLLAAGQGHDKIVELLLTAKSSVDATDFDGRTALHYAATCTNNKNSGPFLRIVKLLLAACPTLLDVVDEEGCTALLCAVKQKKEVIVNQLLLAAANNNSKSLDAEDSCGMNVLHYAIQQENEALGWWLLELKPDLIHRASANGFTPLHMAIQWRSRPGTLSTSPLNGMQSKLFRLCPQVATDYDKEFLLQVAVRNDCESDLDLYLPQSTFDQVVVAFRAMSQKSPEGRLRPLIDAQCGPVSMVLNQDVMGVVYEYLFTQQQRNEVGEETEESNQQLIRWFDAVMHGDKELVKTMLGEDPSLLAVSDVIGDTALHLAAGGGSSGHNSIVELLLAASPTLGLLGNNQGTTALMCAAERGHDRAAEMLIAACPDSLDLVDRGHCTALLHASSGQKTVSAILAANPTNLEATDAWGYNALHHAIRDKLVERVEKLLELDPSLVCNLDSRLQTPLWLAVEKGANKLIKRLFDMFPQALHMAAETGLTPYGVAARYKNNFAVDFFMPKLTFEENVREFRKFHAFFSGYGKRLRSVIDVQCEDAALVLNPTLMSTIYSYLGFGTLRVLTTKE